MASDPSRGKPAAASAGVARRMAAQATRDTGVELALRRRLHARGYRYRVDHPVLEDRRRRRADLAFPRRKVAVFVDGCFWHVCPEHATWPAHNAAWWETKLRANVARDRDTDARLEAAGWTVVRVWEHESADEATERVIAALS